MPLIKDNEYTYVDDYILDRRRRRRERGRAITYWTQSELYTVEQITLDFWTGQSMDVFRKDYINFIFASNV
jgi:hypothetical protein